MNPDGFNGKDVVPLELQCAEINPPKATLCIRKKNHTGGHMDKEENWWKWVNFETDEPEKEELLDEMIK